MCALCLLPEAYWLNVPETQYEIKKRLESKPFPCSICGIRGTAHKEIIETINKDTKKEKNKKKNKEEKSFFKEWSDIIEEQSKKMRGRRTIKEKDKLKDWRNKVI